MSNPPVTIYSLTTCGWSAKTKQFFKDKGIDAFVFEYDQQDPALRRKIDEEMKGHGASGFPFVKIGSKVVKGFNPDAFERLLKQEARR
jgi:glutaredoxin